MPVNPTDKQKDIIEKLKNYLTNKGYEYSGYTGPEDDSYKFGNPIRCYIKYISIRAWKHPLESLKVIVKKNQRNENCFLCGNDIYGKSRHVFVIHGDPASFQMALRLINTI